MFKLTEGMRAGDLEDLVLPLLTVDEFVSKLDDDAIVIGFYVHDKDAADDLNRFLQKSPTQYLDTDISPAPDQHGYYLVFVELMNDNTIVKNIEDILLEVTPLVSIKEWQIRVRGQEKIMPFSNKFLAKYFTRLRNENVENATHDTDAGASGDDEIVEFLEASDLLGASIQGGKLILEGAYTSIEAQVVGFGAVDDLIKNHKLLETALSFDFTGAAESRRITIMMGEGWGYVRAGDLSILEKNDSGQAILLQNARLR
jgi:hypothetical protein